MGLFDFMKNKDNSNEQVEIPESKQFKGSSIEQTVTQDVSICMNSMGITKMPALRFFYNDKGIFEGIFESHINDPQVDMIRKMYGDDMYLNLLGCHALGVGAYVTLCQNKYKKSVADFTIEEATEINNSFHETDPYELALKALGYAVDGNNKKCLDRIVIVGMNSYKKAAGSNVFDRNNLKDFMHVMYNAGITVVLR